MFENFGNDRADCNYPEIISCYSFNAAILQFSNRNRIAIAECWRDVATG